MNNDPNNSPTSNDEARNRANNDSMAGNAPANTSNWSRESREAYESQYAWNKSQQSN